MNNVNTKTGIPYGVLHGNNVPELLDDIMSNGDNITFNGIREELIENIRDAIAGAVDEYTFRAKQIVDDLDCEEILSSLEDRGLWDSHESYENEYEYSYESEHGEVKLLLGWLGGAPLIWVIESPFVANCRPCSPCVPGAGDLNSPDLNGMTAYCLPPDDMPEDWNGKTDVFRGEKHGDKNV